MRINLGNWRRLIVSGVSGRKMEVYEINSKINSIIWRKLSVSWRRMGVGLILESILFERKLSWSLRRMWVGLILEKTRYLKKAECKGKKDGGRINSRTNSNILIRLSMSWRRMWKGFILESTQLFEEGWLWVEF